MSVIQGDITDYGSVLEASRGADLVIHTASLVDVWHRVPETLIHSVNVTGENGPHDEKKEKVCAGSLTKASEETDPRPCPDLGRFQGSHPMMSCHTRRMKLTVTLKRSEP